MKINEVEKILDIPKATIRFYEKEGLLSPQRNENSYREYSQADVERLKKIIVLRKIGIPVDAIKQVLSDSMGLQEAVADNLNVLQEQIKELEGAMKLCKMIQKNQESLASFDEDYYWDVIHAEEEKGSKFFELLNDVITFEKRVIGNEFNLLDKDGKLRFSLGKSILLAVITCMGSGLVYFLLEGLAPKAFLRGLLVPFEFILIGSVLGLPVYFLEKKHKKAASVVKKIGVGLGLALLAAALALILFSVL